MAFEASRCIQRPIASCRRVSFWRDEIRFSFAASRAIAAGTAMKPKRADGKRTLENVLT